MEHLRADLSRVLRSLFASVDPGLALDDNGMVTLGFADGCEITLEVPPDGATVYAHAAIARLPLRAPEALLRQALARNLFRVGQPNGWIALDGETQALTLCATLGAHEVGEAPVGAFLEGMLGTLQALRRDFLADGAPAAPSSELPTDAILIRS